MFNIFISKNIEDSNDTVKYGIIRCFTSFCVNEMNLKGDFNLYLFDTSDEDKPQNITLACYMMNNNDVWVRSNGRIAMDINRSIAHELVHMKQMENGLINESIEVIYDLSDMSGYTDIGGNIEDEANAIAGQLCKFFTKKYNCKWIYNY